MSGSPLLLSPRAAPTSDPHSCVSLPPKPHPAHCALGPRCPSLGEFKAAMTALWHKGNQSPLPDPLPPPHPHIWSPSSLFLATT